MKKILCTLFFTFLSIVGSAKVLPDLTNDDVVKKIQSSSDYDFTLDKLIRSVNTDNIIKLKIYGDDRNFVETNNQGYNKIDSEALKERLREGLKSGYKKIRCDAQPYAEDDRKEFKHLLGDILEVNFVYSDEGEEFMDSYYYAISYSPISESHFDIEMITRMPDIGCEVEQKEEKGRFKFF